MRQKTQQKHPLTGLTVLVLGLLLLVISSAGANPALHAWIHDWEPSQCASAEGHDQAATPQAHDDSNCAISLFAHGLTSFDAPQLVNLAEERAAETVLLQEKSAPGRKADKGTPSCGPPLA